MNNSDIDYKEILKKYMKHIEDYEGTDFVESIFPSDGFSKDEVVVLETISSDIKD